MEKRLAQIAIIYLIVGLIFAVLFALYYHWPIYSFFSPGFFTVLFTWPFQTIGFINDLQRYGFAGPNLLGG